MNHKRATADIRSLVAVVQTRQLPFLAAAIAYYAFLSIIPLLIVAITLAAALAGEAVATEVLATFNSFLTPSTAALIEETLVSGSGAGGVTAVGLAVLLWSALRVFRGLDIAFSRIYGANMPKPILSQVRDALLVLFGIVLAVAGTVALSAILSVVNVPFAGLTGTIGLVIVLTSVFFPMYYIFPNRDIPAREAIPGAVVAGLGWTVLGAGFGLYAANASSLELYGVLGGVLLLLVWFYFGGLIILLGAAVNVVRSERKTDRQLQQEGLREHTQRSMTEADGPSDDDAHADTETDETGTDEPATAPPEPANNGDNGDDGSGNGDNGDGEDGPTGRHDPDVSARVTQSDLDELRREIDEMEDRLDNKTVHRDELEADLKQYIRKRSRRGKATGWGPYLVLLYGTLMTLGAFYFLSSGFAVLAMLVIWLSTLGLYALMVIIGVTVKGVQLPGKLLDVVRNLR
ncbi:YihY/virulence factor BrkB family protein [Halovenus halobia]|uniref:YihY/virulence factor BrkB family protein n=1 Tax=Halovenus halobia TaxID=3396622 RepID=UPI003F546F5A